MSGFDAKNCHDADKHYIVEFKSGEIWAAYYYYKKKATNWLRESTVYL